MSDERTAVAVLLTLAVVAVVGLGVTRWRASRPAPLLPLEEALGSELAGGRRLVESPDAPGPYRRAGSNVQTPRGAGGGGRWQNGVSEVSRQLVPQPGVEQLAVALETADGRLTVAVLAR